MCLLSWPFVVPTTDLWIPHIFFMPSFPEEYFLCMISTSPLVSSWDHTSTQSFPSQHTHAVVPDQLLSACPIRIRSWDLYQPTRGKLGLSMACENTDFLLAALHWQKGELNPVIVFGPHVLVPYPGTGLCGRLSTHSQMMRKLPVAACAPCSAEAAEGSDRLCSPTTACPCHLYCGTCSSSCSGSDTSRSV